MRSAGGEVLVAWPTSAAFGTSLDLCISDVFASALAFLRDYGLPRVDVAIALFSGDLMWHRGMGTRHGHSQVRTKGRLGINRELRKVVLDAAVNCHEI